MPHWTPLFHSFCQMQYLYCDYELQICVPENTPQVYSKDKCLEAEKSFSSRNAETEDMDQDDGKENNKERKDPGDLDVLWNAFSHAR